MNDPNKSLQYFYSRLLCWVSDLETFSSKANLMNLLYGCEGCIYNRMTIKNNNNNTDPLAQPFKEGIAYFLIQKPFMMVIESSLCWMSSCFHPTTIGIFILYGELTSMHIHEFSKIMKSLGCRDYLMNMITLILNHFIPIIHFVCFSH